ncbi:tetratricopeptide repeat protein [Cellulomonas sp. Leaf334]|uniref:tetratricopeptide repeat protein n=1 Tax=Cellulomonas sp. Leaf334 TaxID=1736339 RepID=UPI003519251A
MTELQRWSRRVDQFWETADDDDAEAVLEGMKALVAERPVGDPAALLEWAGAHDSVGLEAEAVPLYRQALAAGLDPEREARAIVQLASSLRNVGDPIAAVELLRAAPDHPAVGAARGAFLALALFDAGQPGEALATALHALTPTLPGYRRALDYYASQLPTSGTSSGMTSAS